MVQADAILRALDADGEALAILEGDTVVVANEAARGLGDLVALAQRREAGDSALVRNAAGRRYEVRVRTLDPPSLRALTGRDVTDREELRELLGRSEEVLSLAAHELKGPLHVLGMVCHLMESRSARGEMLDAPTIDRLRRQVTRLNRLINEMLDVSRAQENRLFLDVDQVDLAQVVREIVASMQQPNQPRAADLRVQLVESAPLRADRVRLGAAVHQLIDNALRFTPMGTLVEVRLAADGEDWTLQVRDQGAGVPPQERDSLFERVSRRAKRKGAQGLGLGLYLSAIVARLHGGALTFAPTVPTGATFTLRLPRAE